MAGAEGITGFAVRGPGLEIDLAGSQWEGEELVLRRFVACCLIYLKKVILRLFGFFLDFDMKMILFSKMNCAH